MEIVRNFSRGKGYIDGITIINLEGEILFTAKFNDRLSQQTAPVEVVGKNFAEVYREPSFHSSTMFKCMDIGMPIYIENQSISGNEGRQITISALSVPIKSGNRIVGAIDLSTQEFDVEKERNSVHVGLSANQFPKGALDSMTADYSVRYTLEDVIAEDKSMDSIKEYIPVVAGCNLPVMICGESGTGKSMTAQIIHNESPRSRRKFVVQNCASIPEQLLDSVLFGNEMNDGGLVRIADGGTLFLQEVDRLPISVQSKLLRVAQTGALHRIGSSRDDIVDVKLITTLSQNPWDAIQNGTLRQDLYCALAIMSISMPPLRQRLGDISALISIYVKRHNRTFYKKIEYIEKEVITALQNYDWPGNIWELEQIVVFGMSRVNPNSDTLKMSDIEERFAQMKRNATTKPRYLNFSSSLPELMAQYESNLIEEALALKHRNVSEAAKLLQIPRQTLQRKIKQYNL